jgi:hypothetical protein
VKKRMIRNGCELRVGGKINKLKKIVGGRVIGIINKKRKLRRL